MMMDVGNKKCKKCGSLLHPQTINVHEHKFFHVKRQEFDSRVYIEVMYHCPEHGNHQEPNCKHSYEEMPGYMFEHMLFCRSCGYHVIQDSSG